MKALGGFGNPGEKIKANPRHELTALVPNAKSLNLIDSSILPLLVKGTGSGAEVFSPPATVSTACKTNFTPEENAVIKPLLNTCIKCHKASDPIIPFEDAAALAKAFATPAVSNPKKLLYDELVLRLYSTRDDHRMPTGAPLPDEKRKLLDRYFKFCREGDVANPVRDPAHSPKR